VPDLNGPAQVDKEEMAEGCRKFVTDMVRACSTPVAHLQSPCAAHLSVSPSSPSCAHLRPRPAPIFCTEPPTAPARTQRPPEEIPTIAAFLKFARSAKGQRATLDP
jgi:hypothetical protein